MENTTQTTTTKALHELLTRLEKVQEEIGKLLQSNPIFANIKEKDETFEYDIEDNSTSVSGTCSVGGYTYSVDVHMSMTENKNYYTINYNDTTMMFKDVNEFVRLLNILELNKINSLYIVVCHNSVKCCFSYLKLAKIENASYMEESEIYDKLVNCYSEISEDLDKIDTFSDVAFGRMYLTAKDIKNQSEDNKEYRLKCQGLCRIKNIPYRIETSTKFTKSNIDQYAIKYDAESKSYENITEFVDAVNHLDFDSFKRVRLIIGSKGVETCYKFIKIERLVAKTK